MSVDVGIKQLKIISRGDVSSSLLGTQGHRDARVGESAHLIFIQFDSEGVLSVLKPRVSSKEGFSGDT